MHLPAMHFPLLQVHLMALIMLLGMGWTAASTLACTTNADCADGNACNGSEVCQAGVCIPGMSITCDDANACSVDVCDPVAGCIFTPTDGCLLGGKRLRLAIGAELRIGLQTGPEMAGMAFPANYTNDDPVVHGASLRVLTTAGDMFDNIYPLPRESWVYVKGAGANVGYKYTDFHGMHGPVTLAVVRNGKPAKIKARGQALNFTLGTNPEPVQIVLRFGNDGRRYCLGFGGRTRFYASSRFSALASSAPASCP
ncbi:MAG TPA: hypothetical protein VEM57_08335 [Candidatus Binatus sp.]|nr:hypothetical protein [Candidatus Binatus sp.]